MSWQRKVASLIVSLVLWATGSILVVMWLDASSRGSGLGRGFEGVVYVTGVAGVGMGILIHALADACIASVDCSCKIKNA
jgi:hypothetical protein